jgi:methionyl aminopeptidase
MSIGSDKDVVGLRRIGRIVALAVREMSKHIRPGITTAELDEVGRAFLHKCGARSAPKLVYNFPGTTCISVNDEAAHGIPGNRIVRAGDLVNLDVSAELDGYFADTGATIPVPPISPISAKLCQCTQAALNRAIATVQVGAPINLIGKAVEAEARRCGFSVIQELGGHGVGRSIHEEPSGVLNYYEPRDRRRLTAGLVFTIEPFLSTGATYVVTSTDRWTLKTPDGSLTAQYEHTLIVTRRGSIIVTAV